MAVLCLWLGFAVVKPGTALGSALPGPAPGTVEGVHFGVERGYYTEPFLLHLSPLAHEELRSVGPWTGATLPPRTDNPIQGRC
jgi:hypothetical protein